MAEIKIHNPTTRRDTDEMALVRDSFEIESLPGTSTDAWIKLLATPQEYFTHDNDFAERALERILSPASAFLIRYLQELGIEIEAHVWGPYKLQPIKGRFERPLDGLAESRRRMLGFSEKLVEVDHPNALDLARAKGVHELTHAIQFEHFVLGTVAGKTSEIEEISGGRFFSLTGQKIGRRQYSYGIINELTATLMQQQYLKDECGWSIREKNFKRSAEQCGISQDQFTELGGDAKDVRLRARYAHKAAEVPDLLKVETQYQFHVGEILEALKCLYGDQASSQWLLRNKLLPCVLLGKHREFYGELSEYFGKAFECIGAIDANREAKLTDVAFLHFWNEGKNRESSYRQRVVEAWHSSTR